LVVCKDKKRKKKYKGEKIMPLQRRVGRVSKNASQPGGAQRIALDGRGLGETTRKNKNTHRAHTA